MIAFHLPFPESEEVLAIYYALQEAGLPCNIARSPDPAMIRLRLCPYESKAEDYSDKVRAFVAGWVACYYREDIPSTDRPLEVSERVKPRKCLDEKTCKDF